jgi:hypothetical protein
MMPVLALYCRTVVRLTQSTRLSPRFLSKGNLGDEMNLTARFLLLIASVSGVTLLTGSAWANPAALKCNSQRDQIWVYDSLNSFGVEAKLNCGGNVEIIERVKDYVKIRAQNGVQGYIPETSVADLPPLEVRQDPTRDIGLVAKQAQA